MATQALPGIYFCSKAHFDLIKYADEYQTIISLVNVEVPDEHSYAHHQLYVGSWRDMQKFKEYIYPIFDVASEENKVLVHCELGCNRCTGFILRRFEFGRGGAKNSLQMQGRRRARLHRVGRGG